MFVFNSGLFRVESLSQNEIDGLKKDWGKFQRSETTKREIGWDSIWKMVNRNN